MPKGVDDGYTPYSFNGTSISPSASTANSYAYAYDNYNIISITAPDGTTTTFADSGHPYNSFNKPPYMDM